MGPWFLTGAGAVVSNFKHDLACALVGAFRLLVVLQARSRLAGGADAYTQWAVPESDLFCVSSEQLDEGGVR